MAIIRGRRTKFGEIRIRHKGHSIPTSVGSGLYESIFSGSNNESFVGSDGNIPNGYEHRPDLISNLFLETPTTWWIICERNSIFDVFEQLKPGDAIRIPGRL